MMPVLRTSSAAEAALWADENFSFRSSSTSSLSRPAPLEFSSCSSIYGEASAMMEKVDEGHEQHERPLKTINKEGIDSKPRIFRQLFGFRRGLRKIIHGGAVSLMKKPDVEDDTRTNATSVVDDDESRFGSFRTSRAHVDGTILLDRQSGARALDGRVSVIETMALCARHGSRRSLHVRRSSSVTMEDLRSLADSVNIQFPRREDGTYQHYQSQCDLFFDRLLEKTKRRYESYHDDECSVMSDPSHLCFKEDLTLAEPSVAASEESSINDVPQMKMTRPVGVEARARAHTLPSEGTTLNLSRSAFRRPGQEEETTCEPIGSLMAPSRHSENCL